MTLGQHRYESNYTDKPSDKITGFQSSKFKDIFAHIVSQVLYDVDSNTLIIRDYESQRLEDYSRNFRWK